MFASHVKYEIQIAVADFAGRPGSAPVAHDLYDSINAAQVVNDRFDRQHCIVSGQRFMAHGASPTACLSQDATSASSSMSHSFP